ncbi:hypothetical protein [Pseudokineococcus lusitanus]|uniref:Polymerase beta nucleotidyltransferase domain-containing protein n=1 Tax=Pseudokineococcus lusitanus TaxID=763993 RepID=A0A3N1GWE5_9ACTN|nr:hypothetical protein [Pseudokineococcus lusitanus]ROP34583.1 hypothetical protein EDC03_2398 [Pseudokineococcus lusitanus]
MGTTALQALATLRAAADDGRLAALCRRHDVDLVTAFGSAVRVDRAGAEEPAPRDLDVAVRFAGRRGDLVAVVTDLVDLLGLAAVDVMDLGRAGVVARSRALGPAAEPLHEAAPGLHALAQMAALTTEMETERLRRWDLDLLASR